MYRSHPQTLAILNAVRSGAIGEVRLIRTSFCYRTKRIADNVRFKAELAGGAMMDVGCYCLSFARLIAGAEPVWVSATGRIHESGVDEAAAGILRFPGGIVATFACGMTLQADNAASICGSDGYIDIPIPWKPPGSGARFSIARATPPRMDSAGAGAHAPGPPPPREDRVVGDGGDLYAIEADDFADAVFTGNPPRVSENDTLGNMRLLDEVRAQIGLKF
jgi:predicted dehydrogenase